MKLLVRWVLSFGVSTLLLAPSAFAQGNNGLLAERQPVSLGSQGVTVVKLQTILSLLGFYAGEINGVFDPGTQQAVASFQQAAGLEPTGQMQVGDWQRLLPALPATAASSFPRSTPPTQEADPALLGAGAFPVPDVASQPPTSQSAPTPATSTPPQASAQQPAPDAPQTASSSSSPDSVTLPLLREGMRGADVERLQQRLHAMGFYNEPVDGIFGQMTTDAVKTFQSDRGLEPDGIVGSGTWNALFN